MPQWQKSLFGCFDNVQTLFVASVFCTPCTIGSMLAHYYEEDYSKYFCLLGLNPLALVQVRSAIRKKHRIPGSAFHDYLFTILCFPCAAVQTTEEYIHDGCDFHPIQL
ncbi:hypothetical protein BLNAU_718 [Blattamonas nauphoetae]|uniref:Uncharacterized protein n=1 Tax=Blattamonas nauphoetae TaxID=2049346 RepID=A0ABQ9YKA5_9EUKA|nr:hypothetical protein BLNAU_718 [Blattamonas nauphoetae]